MLPFIIEQTKRKLKANLFSKEEVNQQPNVKKSKLNEPKLSKPKIQAKKKPTNQTTIQSNPRYFLKLDNFSNSCYANSTIQSFLALGQSFYNIVIYL